MQKIFSFLKTKVDTYLIFLMIFALIIGLTKFLPAESLKLILAFTAFASTIPVIINSIKALLKKEINVEQLATIALVLSLIAGEYQSAVFINLMLAFARLFSDYTENRTNYAIQHLIKLRPKSAKVKREEVILEILIDDIKKGDEVIVHLGDRIPVDGIIVAGEAAIDQSSFTGESLPVEKRIGDCVFTSTLVSSGSLNIKADKVGKETSFEKIINLIENSQENKAKISRLGDKFAKVYLISSFAVALIVYIFTHNLDLVLGLLLVVCADDIAVAVPLAYLRAIGVAAKNGVIIKGSSYLEGMNKINQIIFDKTGTLTTGKLQVEKFAVLNNMGEYDALGLARTLSSSSKHPVSKCISQYAEKKGVPVVKGLQNILEISGKGIRGNYANKEVLLGRADFLKEKKIHIDEKENSLISKALDEGKNVTCLAYDGELYAIITSSDEVKEDSAETISELRELGIKNLVMLTGDNEKVAASISKQIGLTEFHANLFPEDKLQYVKEHIQNKENIAMVGDGVNDAPVLTLASIGIAMGQIGSDTAIESANIVLMNDNISKLSYLVRLSRNVNAIVMQNFTFWGIANIIGISLVFVGIFNPALAAAYNFLTDFIPILNSFRVGNLRQSTSSDV